MEPSDKSEAQTERELARCEQCWPSRNDCYVFHLCRFGEKVTECLDSIVALLFTLRTQSRWATVREAERYAHVSNGVVRDAVNKGELPAYRRSAKSVVLLDLDEIDGWINTTWRIGIVSEREEDAA